MSKRINEKFLDAYLVLDSAMNERFGMKTGGTTEYINRLSAAKLAPGRDTVLPKLVKYRSIRNRFAHEPGVLKNSKEVDSSDIGWVKKFTGSVNKHKDPLALYTKSKRTSNKGGVAKVAVAIVLACAVVAGAVLLLKYLGII